MHLAERLKFALVCGLPLGLLIAGSGWVSTFFRRGFKVFPLSYGIGTVVGVTLAFALVAVLWPLGRTRLMAIALFCAAFYVSGVVGLVSAGQLVLPPTTSDHRDLLLFLGVLTGIFGPLGGMAMWALNQPTKRAAPPVDVH